MARILSPTTGIVHTAINSGMTPIDAVAEFVDNSFGSAAGDADYITVIDAGNAMVFMDNGRGVADIDKMFTLGDSGSRSSDSDIGRFGVGSKFGALTFGTLVTVHTVRGGVYKKHEVDWNRVIDSGKWPVGHNGSNLSVSDAPHAIRDGGTIVMVRNLKSISRPKIQTYTKKLGLRFSSWLDAGKDIKLYRAKSLKNAMNGKFSENVSIGSEFKDFMSKKVQSISISNGDVNGKLFRMITGVIPSGDRDLNGVHINFGGRTVEVLRGNLGNVKLPSKFFARIELGNSWKNSLNYNKTVLIDGRDELIEKICILAKSLLDTLTDSDMKEMFEKLSLEVTNLLGDGMNNLFTHAVNGADIAPVLPGDDFDGTAHVPDNEPNPEPDPNPNPMPNKASNGPADKKDKGVFNFNLKQCDLEDGAPVSISLTFSGNVCDCTVNLNKRFGVIDLAVKGNPQNAPATLILSVKALADHLAKHREDADRLLGKDVMAELTSDKGTDLLVSESIYDRLIKLTVTRKKDADTASSVTTNDDN